MTTDQQIARLAHTLERIDRQLAIVAESSGPLAEWITTAQAGKYYGTSKSTLYRLAEAGKARRSVTGRRTRWNRSDLERHVFGVAS